MKNIVYFFIIIIIVLGNLASTCKRDPNFRRYFHIKNNSDNPVYYEFSFTFPDTNLANIENKPNSSYKIDAHKKAELTSGLLAYNDTTLIFIFDAYVVENESWDSIVAQYKILKRYQLTVSDLQNNNWIVTYP